MTTCQLYMRRLPDGAVITIEPWRARAFPIIKDLVVDRRALDRIMQAGGYISVHTGGAVDAASCIGCGACVAACKNASPALFVGAKVSHLALLPQGKPERTHRVKAMLEAVDREGFGACSNQNECEAVCPKRISVRFIATLNREYLRAGVVESGLPAEPESPHAEST
ncbi:MAG: 4Fe-4S dicluster domain-containing protein [Nitrospira sp.]|nr:4Fe-4S dicluster domain-containing protein [Nitrospira sp.]